MTKTFRHKFSNNKSIFFGVFKNFLYFNLETWARITNICIITQSNVEQNRTLSLCIIGLVIHGFGIAGLMVPTFIDSICSAIAAGFPDDLSTYGVISGLWSSSFALGAFVGPSVSGYLFDVVGFQYGTFFVISTHLLLVSILAIINYMRGGKKL
ncbi:uncharacterized protein [Rhodnius prolixus]|uniref:uncharacterized protein n=1 Tax=Rhodnius prolixus TaxID=13249 RepID=UPI003D18E468